MNGRLVDKKRILDPAQTNYEQYALYSTFDITSGLVKGENCLGVMLGEGWYGQDKVWGAWAKYGDPLFRLQMEITYEDGSKETIVSDESWQWIPGPVLKGNIYAGEVYDATKEIKDWSKAGILADNWNEAVLAESNIPVDLYPQLIEPIRLKNEIKAVKKWKDPCGNWVFDFGVNIAGVPQIKVKQPKGTHLKMRMGELLREDGSVEYNTTGNRCRTNGRIHLCRKWAGGLESPFYIPWLSLFRTFRYGDGTRIGLDKNDTCTNRC